MNNGLRQYFCVCAGALSPRLRQQAGFEDQVQDRDKVREEVGGWQHPVSPAGPK